VLRTLPHPVFERRGDGLLCNTTISLLEALVGFEREVGAVLAQIRGV
jgi:DnaJ-class molecular chaperone